MKHDIEDKRTVLEELLETQTRLCPHLSQFQQASANIEVRRLQEEWRDLEREVDTALHHINVHSQQSSNLLSEIANLQGHLESIRTVSGTKSPDTAQEAQELMIANANVKAAQRKYVHLQEISDALLLGSQWNETKEIQQDLQKVNYQLQQTADMMSTRIQKIQEISNPIMEKIILVMRDGFVWAKETESDIEGRSCRVSLLPEEVHQQLRDLKKLQSEVLVKQSQLESLVEEATELLPQLDQAEEVPLVRSSLESLGQLSKSVSDKLANAVREKELGLQTREKLSAQIADVDSWVEAYLHRETSKSAEGELRSPAETDRRDRQIQETLAEADKQASACQALFVKSKDIAPELSVTDNRQLFDKLINLQDEIKSIISHEKVNESDLKEVIKTGDASKRDLLAIEKSLRQMVIDLSKHRFPITLGSLHAFQSFKHMILEHKARIDLIQAWIPQEKTRELYTIILEIHNKMFSLQMKARDHERYLNTRQCVEDFKESVQEQVYQTKEDIREVDERYKTCQKLIVQFPLIKSLCEEATSKLQVISADLFPSQLAAERQRLKQNEESINTWEMTILNNISIIEWYLLKELDLDSERKATQSFFLKIQQGLQNPPVLEPSDTLIKEEYQKTQSLKKIVESRMRAWEVLQQRKGGSEGSGSQYLTALKNTILQDCDSRMASSIFVL